MRNVARIFASAVLAAGLALNPFAAAAQEDLAAPLDTLTPHAQMQQKAQAWLDAEVRLMEEETGGAAIQVWRILLSASRALQSENPYIRSIGQQWVLLAAGTIERSSRQPESPMPPAAPPKTGRPAARLST
jgi:hypothetical protein